jgi:arsenate reductase
MKMQPSKLLRKNDKAFEKLKSKIEKLSEGEILDLMIKNPNLVQRPIVEKDNKVMLARPAERRKELF